MTLATVYEWYIFLNLYSLTVFSTRKVLHCFISSRYNKKIADGTCSKAVPESQTGFIHFILISILKCSLSAYRPQFVQVILLFNEFKKNILFCFYMFFVVRYLLETNKNRIFWINSFVDEISKVMTCLIHRFSAEYYIPIRLSALKNCTSVA